MKKKQGLVSPQRPIMSKATLKQTVQPDPGMPESAVPNQTELQVCASGMEADPLIPASAEPAGLSYANVTGPAYVLAEALVGLQHRNARPHALPCQDAVQVTTVPRPILVVCDGAGSASVSDIGAHALCQHLSRFCQSLEPLLKPYLDDPLPQSQNMTMLVRLLIRHAIGVLHDLALLHRRPVQDFKSTLNLTIVGTTTIFWLRVGDGEIIQEQIHSGGLPTQRLRSVFKCLGDVDKGEFANQTRFVDDQLTLDQVQWGTLAAETTTGLALMSDGASEKLVAYQRNQVARQLGQWLAQLRQDQLKASDLYQRFYKPDFLARSSGDDRSLALYSRAYITEG